MSILGFAGLLILALATGGIAGMLSANLKSMYNPWQYRWDRQKGMLSVVLFAGVCASGCALLSVSLTPLLLAAFCFALVSAVLFNPLLGSPFGHN